MATSQAAVMLNSHVLHEKRELTPKQWVKRQKLAPQVILPVRIGLKQRNLDRGHNLLMDVSHPGSSNYAKYWTAEDVIKMFGPTDNTIDAVTQWLIEFGIASDRITHSDNMGWLAFDATTEEVESLLHTEYHGYEHSTTGFITPACESYHLPHHIQEHVDYVTPGIRLLAPPTRPRTKIGFDIAGGQYGHGRTRSLEITSSKNSDTKLPVELRTCDVTTTPACIKALYEVPDVPESGSGKPSVGNSLGIFENAEKYAQKDLDLFFEYYASWIPNNTHPIHAFINGASAPIAPKDIANASVEAALDFEVSYPLIYPQTITLYQTDNLGNHTTANLTVAFNTLLDAIDGSYCTYSAFGEEGDDTILDPVFPELNPGGYKGKLQCGVYKPTNVISFSYIGEESALPPYYQERQCNEFMKLGLQGVTIIYGSGDNGVAGYIGPDSPNGCLGPQSTIFSPAWPNTCPYLTNVGGTKVYPGRTVLEPESAAQEPLDKYAPLAFSSGGGFSNIYDQPDYQKAAVAAFFAKYNPPYPYYNGSANFGKNGGLYNRVGRGYPDVAANGENIATFHQGISGLVRGTSASAPIFASIINRINDLRINAGKKPVGFVNPVLYSHPEILNDITNGTNPGCGTVGFSAVPGWDPVTGLGTPNYPKMAKLFLSLP